MADAREVLMVVVDRDAARRVRSVEVYGPGEAPPNHLADFLPHEVRMREVQTKDPRDEAKSEDEAETEGVEALGAGWYRLPDGEKVRGKDAVREAGYQIDE